MELGPVLTLAGGIVTCVITAAVTFYATRSKAKTDLQASLIAGFGAITDQLQEERKELQTLFKEATKEIESLKDTISKKNETIEEHRMEQNYTNLYISQLEYIIKTHTIQELPTRTRKNQLIEGKVEK